MFSRFSEAEFRLAFALGVIYFVLILVVGGQFGTGAEQLGDWGSWLAGTLTPGLILFAFYSFRTAEKARLEQANAQKLMAEITERATFAQHKNSFQGTLYYFGSCVLSRRRLGPGENPVEIQGERDGYKWIWQTLIKCRDGEAEAIHLETLARLKEDETKFFLDEFQKGLLEVLRIAYNARLYYQLDRKLQDLPSLFTYFDLWQFDPHIRVKTQPKSFEDFYTFNVDPQAPPAER